MPLKYGGRPPPRRQCVRWGPSSPHGKGHSSPHFSARVYCGQTVANLATAELLLPIQTVGLVEEAVNSIFHVEGDRLNGRRSRERIPFLVAGFPRFSKANKRHRKKWANRTNCSAQPRPTWRDLGVFTLFDRTWPHDSTRPFTHGCSGGRAGEGAMPP